MDIQMMEIRDTFYDSICKVFFALAFSAAPLTLYVPPVRSLNLFVETVEVFVRETAEYSLRTLPRVRVGFRRIRAAVLRLIHHAR